MIEPQCSICGRKTVFKDFKHLYLAASRLKKELKELADSHPDWRKAIAFTNRIWAENVLDYLSMSKILTDNYGGQENAGREAVRFDELWGKESLHYYVHAKDSIGTNVVWNGFK